MQGKGGVQGFNAGLKPKLSSKSASALARKLILFWDATELAEHLAQNTYLADAMSSMMKNTRMQEHIDILTLASFPHIKGSFAQDAALLNCFSSEFSLIHLSTLQYKVFLIAVRILLPFSFLLAVTEVESNCC